MEEKAELYNTTPMHLIPDTDPEGTTDDDTPIRVPGNVSGAFSNKFSATQVAPYEVRLLHNQKASPMDVENGALTDSYPGGEDERKGSGGVMNLDIMPNDNNLDGGSVIQVRETWDKKIDFLLSVIGFAVDLGNVWRFPYICFRNGGGAFLIPYCLMYIFGGLPLFYLELALGQYQRCGCITVWKRICPMFRGIGFGIIVLASYTAWYYNTIMAWALFYLVDSLRPHVPWDQCGQWWNTNSCVTVSDPRRNLTSALIELGGMNTTLTSSTEEYFYRRVLQVQYSKGFGQIGHIRWHIALCLLVIFLIVYFSIWKGVKSSGKAVWVTAILPYIVLFTLLVRGLMLKGSLKGVRYYLEPNFEVLKDARVWNEAASQIFFSLGPGFGVILTLSSYNRFRNNCYMDSLVTSFINCATSFLAGFVVFSVLGHMCYRLGKEMDTIASEGPGLVFIAYPEAIATLKGSVFWSILFFLMLITLGLDSTYGGLESVITAILDEYPRLRKHRELCVLAFVCYCFLGALPTTTEGGFFVLNWLDQHGAQISILFIVFCECVAICWFYGVDRFSNDVESMLGFKPGLYWRICWTYISPCFLLVIFLMTLMSFEVQPAVVLNEVFEYPKWAKRLGWLVVASSVINIPIFMLWKFHSLKGPRLMRYLKMISPEESPPHVATEEKYPTSIEFENIDATTAMESMVMK
jgi:solute carrier family 6 (neurotransmitter transporter, serotonin) member 4